MGADDVQEYGLLSLFNDVCLFIFTQPAHGFASIHVRSSTISLYEEYPIQPCWHHVQPARVPESHHILHHSPVPSDSASPWSGELAHWLWSFLASQNSVLAPKSSLHGMNEDRKRRTERSWTRRTEEKTIRRPIDGKSSRSGLHLYPMRRFTDAPKRRMETTFITNVGIFAKRHESCDSHWRIQKSFPDTKFSLSLLGSSRHTVPYLRKG